MQFEYVSLSVHDLDAQAAFYTKVFGIGDVRSRLDLPGQGLRSAIVGSPSGLGIEFFEREGAQSRPIRDAVDGAATTGWVHLAIRVDELPPIVERALGAGATSVSSPSAAHRPDTWFSYIKDPEGNLIELVTSTPLDKPVC